MLPEAEDSLNRKFYILLQYYAQSEFHTCYKHVGVSILPYVDALALGLASVVAGAYGPSAALGSRD